MIGWSTAFLLSLFVLQRLSFAGASHFRHGSISWAPTDSYSNTMRFIFRLAWRRGAVYCDQNTILYRNRIGYGSGWIANCYNVSCGSRTIGYTYFYCTDYSENEDWSMGENNFTYTFPSYDKEWVVSYSGCCWIPLSRSSGGYWRVLGIVNLTRRSDNGRINSSPISKSPAIVRWQDGCPAQSLRIPVEDPDGDVVKCRLASYSESSMYPDSFPYGSLDEENCLLTYNGTSGTAGTYAVALILEDFPAGTTNFDSVSPFSAVPLQFLIRISAANGSCNDLPVFTAATPKDGECFEVQIGSAYKTVIEVKLADFSKHISEIVTSSPSGMQLSSLRYHGGVFYRNVTWYPSQYQVGQQLFCFKAVDSTRVESEWRCVTILVGLGNTPRVIIGSQTPTNPISKVGPGVTWWSIHFDRVIKKPRTSSYIRLILLPSGHTVYKVDTLSLYVRINSDKTTLQFATPNAALSMNGSYAILIDHGAVVGQGCSYDGPPTPGITNSSLWQFSVYGICPVGYYLAPPRFTSCVDINECGTHSRSKRSHYYYWWGYTSSSGPSLTVSQSYGISPTASSSYLPFSVMYSGSCKSYIHLTYYNYYNSRGHVFHSPNYPGCYPNNKDCMWLIETNAYNYIRLYIYQFNLEYGGSNCPYDYLEIRDGNSLSSPLITKMCGSLGYAEIYSSGRFLRVRFVSDGSFQRRGFQVYFYATNSRSSNLIPSQQLNSSPAVCFPSQTQSASISLTPSTTSSTQQSASHSRSISSSEMSPTASSSFVPFSVMYPGSCSSYIHLRYYIYGRNYSLSKSFRSPNYPGCYPNNKECTWLIETNAYNYIYLVIDHLNLEYGGSNCPNDYLEIRDGNSLSSPLITRMCGTLGYTYICSSGRSLLMRFVSDGYLQMTGFRGYWYAGDYRFSNGIPSQQIPSSPTVCLPSQTQTASISLTPYLQISPTTSSSMSSSHYAQSSSYALPIPSDFQLHVSADCAQNCRNTPGSYSCSCVSGYQLASDGKSCLDINECSINNGGCSHNCYNIPGSFYCGCPEGTTMAANNLTCVEPGVTVTCGENNMTVSLEKQTFPFFNVSSLHLRYSSCRATQNSTHLLIHTPLNGCGTQVNETQDALIFWNEIQVEVVVIDYVITRTHDVRLPFFCSYSRRKMLSITFKPRNVFFGVEAGYGNFTFKMDFYKTAAFGTPHSEYPIQVDLNEYVYVEYSVESSAHLVIMAENCKATKSENPFSWPQYIIIQNGCPRDTTLDYNYDPTRSFQRFKIKTFRFFDDYNTVYFHCEVLACYRYSPNSRCSRSCLNNKKRKRREVTRDKVEHGESTTKTVLTGGPILITEEKQNTGDTGQSNKQAALIGGVAGASGVGLIAIIALVVLFVKYRIARRFMNRNKVGDLYTTQDEQLSRRNAYIQEDDMIEREDSF